MAWPNDKLDLESLLSDLGKAAEASLFAESPEAVPIEGDAAEAKEEAPEESEEPVEPREEAKVEEYDGWDPITWTEFVDGEEIHYRLTGQKSE